MFDIPITNLHLYPNPNTYHNIQPETDIIPIRRSDRFKRQPAFLKDYHCHSISSPPDTDILYPLSHVLSYNNISKHHFTFLSAISTEIEPKNYKEASQSQPWIQAMNTGLDALQHNSTWTLQTYHKVRNQLGANGSIK